MRLLHDCCFNEHSVHALTPTASTLAPGFPQSDERPGWRRRGGERHDSVWRISPGLCNLSVIGTRSTGGLSDSTAARRLGETVRWIRTRWPVRSHGRSVSDSVRSRNALDGAAMPLPQAIERALGGDTDWVGARLTPHDRFKLYTAESAFWRGTSGKDRLSSTCGLTKDAPGQLQGQRKPATATGCSTAQT